MRSETYYKGYLPTYLPPRSRVFLEKLIVTQLVKAFPAFYGTQRFITVFTRAHLPTNVSEDHDTSIIGKK
jgi:hypothetical protein